MRRRLMWWKDDEIEEVDEVIPNCKILKSRVGAIRWVFAHRVERWWSMIEWWAMVFDFGHIKDITYFA